MHGGDWDDRVVAVMREEDQGHGPRRLSSFAQPE